MKEKKLREDISKIGPGCYNIPEPDVVKHCNPRWTIRTKPELEGSKLEEHYPGPADYNTLTKSKAPLFTMGVKYRLMTSHGIEHSPSPASYNTLTNFYKSTGISFTKSKRRDGSVEEKSRPGPNRYSTLSGKKIKGGRFSTSKRERNEAQLQTLPGPGSYETSSCFGSDKKKKRRCTIKSVRNQLMKTNVSFDTPGPGNYSINQSSFDKIRGITMGVKPESKLNQTLPGPADYNNTSPKTLKGGKIGTSNRLLSFKAYIDPSPQSYTPSYSSIKRKTPRFTIPSSRKPIKITETPGPCPPLQTLKKQLKSSLVGSNRNGTSCMLSRTKKSTLSIREGPGPSQYFPISDTVLPTKHAFSMRKESKESQSPVRKFNEPGPGSYENRRRGHVQNILF